jgi:hypothetical protein
MNVTGRGKINEADLPAFREWVDAHQSASEAQVAKVIELTRITGKEAVYDMTMFDMAWSPVFMHPARDPVAWIKLETGERRAGADYPGDDA